MSDKEHIGTKNLIPAQKGEVRNPKGRPKGSRNKLSERFLTDFLSDWDEGGLDAIKRVREKDPSTYLRVAASIVPKEFTINQGDNALERLLEQYSASELGQLIDGLERLGSADIIENPPQKENTD